MRPLKQKEVPLPFEQRLTLGLRETADKLGVGRNTIYQLLRAKKLKAVKLGSRTGITTDSIRALLEAA